MKKKLALNRLKKSLNYGIIGKINISDERNIQGGMTMKKLFATLVTLCLCFGFCSTAYALSPDDLTAGEESDVRTSEVYDLSEISIYNGFDYVSDMLETYSLKQYENNGDKLIWAVSSLNKHLNVQYRIFENNGSDTYEKMISTIDDEVDFIQIGALMNNDLMNTVKESFESDAAKATVETIFPADTDDEGWYDELTNSNIPIYWNIEESNTDVFTLEVAVGKYVIQPGDTLSEIALKFGTSVEKLLDDNQNITNPDLIYAYDYLVIK